MPKKKSVSFDAMVKFFMQNYNIPTKRDIEKLMQRLDRLEDMVRETAMRIHMDPSKAGKTRPMSGKSGMTASDTVLRIIKEAGQEGAGFAEIKEKTGFNEKKIRNIVFRLNKLEKINRKSRGVYIAAE